MGKPGQPDASAKGDPTKKGAQVHEAGDDLEEEEEESTHVVPGLKPTASLSIPGAGGRVQSPGKGGDENSPVKTVALTWDVIRALARQTMGVHPGAAPIAPSKNLNSTKTDEEEPKVRIQMKAMGTQNKWNQARTPGFHARKVQPRVTAVTEETEGK